MEVALIIGFVVVLSVLSALFAAGTYVHYRSQQEVDDLLRRAMK